MAQDDTTTQSHNHHQILSNQFPAHVPYLVRIPKTQDGKTRIGLVSEWKMLFDF